MKSKIYNLHSRKSPECFYENMIGALTDRDDGLYDCGEGHQAYFLVQGHKVCGLIFASHIVVEHSTVTMDVYGEDFSDQTAS